MWYATIHHLCATGIQLRHVNPLELFSKFIITSLFVWLRLLPAWPAFPHIWGVSRRYCRSVASTPASRSRLLRMRWQLRSWSQLPRVWMRSRWPRSRPRQRQQLQKDSRGRPKVVAASTEIDDYGVRRMKSPLPWPPPWRAGSRVVMGEDVAFHLRCRVGGCRGCRCSLLWGILLQRVHGGLSGLTWQCPPQLLPCVGKRGTSTYGY